jgi:hypothetical protein
VRRGYAPFAWIVLALGAAPAAAQISVNPTGVSTRTLGPSTAFLTFRNLQPGQQAAEGVWCGEIDPLTRECEPGTIFGRLPSGLDLGRQSGSANFTDIMTIPPSVARRAYQAAERGDDSEFFYVRRFVSTLGPDEFVAVSCRLAGGGARSPFGLVDVKMRFEADRPVVFVPRSSSPPPLRAEIVYNGSGRLKGRWEVVLPGDLQPSGEDLLPEPSLPAELRGSQRRYTLIERFDAFLPPTGKYVLRGPDPARLPSDGDGLHLVLLRIEATDDQEARSDTGAGVVTSGGVAGFSMPPLRYYVGTGEDEEVIATLAAAETLEPIAPLRDESLSAARPVNFSWIGLGDAAVYKLEVESGRGPALAAVVGPTVSSYTAPPLLQARVNEPLRWRVVAIGSDGNPVARSPWRDFRVVP